MFLTKNYHTIHLLITLTLLLILGVNNAFIQDDAFISFRYAFNFAQGNGLVWNVGEEPIAGYTNFLWTILMSVPIILDQDPVLWSMIFSIILALGTLFFTYLFVLNLTELHYVSLLSIILLGTNYTFSSYFTGGLETQLQAFLIILSVYVSFLLFSQSYKQHTNWKLYPILSVIFSLAILTRLDSSLICGILFLAVVFSIYKNEEKTKLYKLTLLIAPGLFIVGTWLFFMYIYYGDILPNTYYLKATRDTSFSRGIVYVALFFILYGLFPFLILWTLYFLRVQKKLKFTWVLSVVLVFWILYIIKVSGDFMEFRFFVTIMPVLYILISIVISSFGGSRKKAVSIIFLLGLSLYHGVFFQGTNGIESIHRLNAHVTDKGEDWQTVGQVVGDMFFDTKTPVVISTTAAGAIPYYSKLPTIDMLGLNDKWIAKNGIKRGSRPGHTRYTTIQYLIDSEVDLVLGHPKVVDISSPPTINVESFFHSVIRSEVWRLPQTAKVIQIPLNSSNFRVDILYISKNQAVDNAIQKFGLVTNKLKKRDLVL